MAIRARRCDDANLDDDDSCLSDCTWNGCSDGAVYVGEDDPDNPYEVEECDDANQHDTDSWPSGNMTEPGYRCR